jgi:hypothetical protein
MPLLAGDYPIGRVMYANRPYSEFGINEHEWIRHCGIFGKTGSGKTTLAMNIIRELCRHDNPFLIFDYKRNYRDLINEPEFKDVLIFTVGRNNIAPFYFNPKNAPPGIESHIWVKQLHEIIEKVYLLGPGAGDSLMELAHAPTFKDMHDTITKLRKRGREMLWWASAKRTLNAINYTGLYEMVNTNPGHDIPDLLDRKVILELDGLTAYDRAFVIGSLLLWIYHYRMRQPDREILKHFIIVEEAHHLFLKTRKEEDIADIIMREIRELGEAMIIIDQHPSKMSVSALGNLSTKFALALSLNEDVSAIANAMLLDRDQQKFLSMLRVGESICRSDRLLQPLHLQLPAFPVQKGSVGDEAIQRLMKPFFKLSNQNINTDSRCLPLPAANNVEYKPPPGELILLQEMAREPFLGTDNRYKKLGISSREGNEYKNNLIDNGHINPVQVDRKVLYELTPKARTLLTIKNIKTPGQARGGIEHNYWLEQIKELFKSKEGFPFKEKDDIDLVVETYDSTFMIQVETGKSNIKKNIETLLKQDCNNLIMIATNKDAKLKINTILQKISLPEKEKIKVFFIKDFLSKNPISQLPEVL